MIVKSIGTVFAIILMKTLKTLKKLITYYTQLKLKQSKNMKKLLALFVVVLGFSAVSFAQSTATAVSSATIIGPITLSKTVDLNFGNVAVDNTLGTVLLTNAGVRSKTGGVTLPAITGTVTPAKFKVNGEGTSTYSITLPTTDQTISDGASHNMTINAFECSAGAVGTLVGGTQDFTVGATLNVGASQATGVYTGSFNVTVNYN